MGKADALLVMTPGVGDVPELKPGARILLPAARRLTEASRRLCGSGTATASATEPTVPVPNATPGFGFAPGDPASHFKP